MTTREWPGLDLSTLDPRGWNRSDVAQVRAYLFAAGIEAVREKQARVRSLTAEVHQAQADDEARSLMPNQYHNERLGRLTALATVLRYAEVELTTPKGQGVLL